MNIKRVNPYIIFNGTAGSAIKLYENALGAKVENIQKYGDVPDMKVAPEQKDHIIHAELRIGGSTVMVSDSTPEHAVRPEGNVQITLDFGDLADGEKAFRALSEGGTVTQPLVDAFWGAKFGMLTDAHGVRWMFNCPLNKA